jgi:hypothetical protein
MVHSRVGCPVGFVGGVLGAMDLGIADDRERACPSAELIVVSY